ncbi:MAG TPA: hypothetical protein VHO46_00300 [Bacteroidales bacterium]|nr:hypothetical protein [Bacteroidales bacterium]
MKRVIISIFLVLFISCASFGKKLIAEGTSFTKLGNFRIESSDAPVILNGQELETYQIIYLNSGDCLTVVLEKDRDCMKYVTMSEKLSVQYVCHGTYFGVERLTDENSIKGITTSDEHMNRTAYFHQRVITSGKNDQITNLKLIGAYFPELLKSEPSA